MSLRKCILISPAPINEIIFLFNHYAPDSRIIGFTRNKSFYGIWLTQFSFQSLDFNSRILWTIMTQRQECLQSDSAHGAARGFVRSATTSCIFCFFKLFNFPMRTKIKNHAGNACLNRPPMPYVFSSFFNSSR